MNDYIINMGTLLLQECEKGSTKVYEDKIELDVDTRLSTVISESCKYFGSSYQGRVMGSQELIRNKMKLPIIMEESNCFIIFPISSPRRENCTWIVFNNISSYFSIDNYNTRIVFFNNVSVDLPVTSRIIENQMNRARKLHYEINVRKNALKAIG